VSTLLVHAGRNGQHYKALFERAAPGLAVVAWPDTVAPATVAYVAGWKLPDGFFAPFVNLKAIFALAAGVDRLLARTDLPAHVPLVRLLDAGMAEQMADYALYGVLGHQRRMLEYGAQQARGEWRTLPPRVRADLRIGVLGIGAIGGVIATALARWGYAVSGWSRSPRSVDGVRCVHGADALDPLLAQSDVLVNVLPTTPETRNLLDGARLSRLPRGAYVINCSRGDQLNADALVELLDAGHLDGALLDVFAVEPLPPGSPLWRHPKVRITPHIAAITLPEPSVAQIVANIRALESGIPMRGIVDRTRSY
jgi:glyoxylate/hydroxypyruvate reductase A